MAKMHSLVFHLQLVIKSPKLNQIAQFFFRIKLELLTVKWYSNNIDANNSNTSKNKLALFVAKMRHDFFDNPITYPDSNQWPTLITSLARCCCATSSLIKRFILCNHMTLIIINYDFLAKKHILPLYPTIFDLRFI